VTACCTATSNACGLASIKLRDFLCRLLPSWFLGCIS